MKKTITLICLMFIGIISESQVNDHALGLRLRGDGRGNGAELSYQHGLGSSNRLEFDLGGRSHKNWNTYNLAVLYHWVMELKEGFNWYVGLGGSVGQYRSKSFYSDGLTLAFGGQIGIEFDLSTKDVPLLLSVDWRPMWNIWTYQDYDSFGYEGGFSIRYIF